MRYVEERPRRRWPRAAVTPRAQGGCGLIQRQNPSPVSSHRNRHPSLSEPRKTPARDPLYFFNSLLEDRSQIRPPERDQVREDSERTRHAGRKLSEEREARVDIRTFTQSCDQKGASFGFCTRIRHL